MWSPSEEESLRDLQGPWDPDVPNDQQIHKHTAVLSTHSNVRNFHVLGRLVGSIAIVGPRDL